VTVSGSHKSLATPTSRGTVRLTVFWPAPSSWTLKDAVHAQNFAIAMEKGPLRESEGTIVNPKKTLATFSVDKSGEGSITYSDRRKAKILNWLPAN